MTCTTRIVVDVTTGRRLRIVRGDVCEVSGSGQLTVRVGVSEARSMSHSGVHGVCGMRAAGGLPGGAGPPVSTGPMPPVWVAPLGAARCLLAGTSTSSTTYSSRPRARR